jgi:hypothetical protein
MDADIDCDRNSNDLLVLSYCGLRETILLGAETPDEASSMLLTKEKAFDKFDTFGRGTNKSNARADHLPSLTVWALTLFKVYLVLFHHLCAMISNTGYVDARRSNFNRAGRDQYIYTINLTIDSSIPEGERRRLLRDHLPHVQVPPRSLTSSPEISTPAEIISRSYTFAAGSPSDVASWFIEKTKKLLDDHTESTDNDRALWDELELLRQTLILTDLAMQTFEYTPLGRNLARSINPQAEQCCDVLRDLFDSINRCRQNLFPTRIWNLWRVVWWCGGEMDGQALLRKKLIDHRILLGRCLKSLNS